MADLATPSGAAMFSADASEKKQHLEKPEKPDEEVYKASLKKAEKEHADSMVKFNAIKAKIDIAQPNKNKDSPASKRRAELLARVKEIREEQSTGKAGRNKAFDEIKRLDEKLKAKIAEQKTARSRVSFKNVDEVDREIARLDKQVDTGMMKLVDEKKAIAEISSLKKQRKNFVGFEQAQKEIDDLKAELKMKRDALDDPKSKALSEEYNKLQGELDAIKAEQDEAYKNLNSLRDERTKLQAEQQEKYLAIKQIKDNYYQQNRAVQSYEFEARKKLRERKKLEQENYEKEKKKERAQKLLAEASDKAYLDEIRKAESLLRYFDPTYAAEKAPLQAPSKFGAQATRTIDDSGLKGFKVVRKDEEEDYFKGTGGKKGKKGRKGTPAADGTATPPPVSGKFSCPPSVMEDCAAMNIDPPMSATDVPAVLEKVRAKLDFFKNDQNAQTERNIAKARKEVERLDAEDSAHGTAAPINGHGHGETKATASVDEGGSVANEVELLKNAAADVIADLKGASLEDNAE